MNFIEKQNKENLIEIIKTSKNKKEVFQKLGVSKNSGGNQRLLNLFIKENNIDISHFEILKSNERNDFEIFVKNSDVSQKILREHFKRGNYSEYKCSICGLEPIWNNKPLTLTLDHIDGNNTNNELNNLRWVCPNCDRQLPTFGAKNKKTKKIYNYCIKCKKEIRNNKTQLCLECYHKQRQENSKYEYKNLINNKKICPICSKNLIKLESNTCLECLHKIQRNESLKKLENIISREELKKMIRTYSQEELSKIFKVNRGTIRKWCKQYNIPSSKTQSLQYSDEEWELL